MSQQVHRRDSFSPARVQNGQFDRQTQSQMSQSCNAYSVWMPRKRGGLDLRRAETHRRRPHTPYYLTSRAPHAAPASHCGQYPPARKDNVTQAACRERTLGGRPCSHLLPHRAEVGQVLRRQPARLRLLAGLDDLLCQLLRLVALSTFAHR